MHWWQRIVHTTHQRIHAFHERLKRSEHTSGTSDWNRGQPRTLGAARKRLSVSRVWPGKQARNPTDISKILTDCEVVTPAVGSDAYEEGSFTLRLTSPAGATVTVTEMGATCYLCRYEPPSPWLRHSAEAAPEYYRFEDCSWLELADTVVPLLSLGWDIDESVTTQRRQRSLAQTGD